MSQNENRRQLLGPAKIKHFVMSGDAIFSLKNTKNGHHLTYRVSVCEKKPELFFVSVLTGPDNTSNYTYLGPLRDDKYTSGLKFEHGKKSPIAEDATTVKTARWFFDRLNKKEIPAALEIWHEGRCGRCARRLTVPGSIDMGIGPECVKKMAANY